MDNNLQKTLLNNLKREANNRFIFAINQPQDFADAWQRAENAINNNFDNKRFDKYKKIIQNQAIKFFCDEPFPLRETAIKIHAWQVRFLDVALRKCRG